MTMIDRAPTECFHPSELIRDELTARGWSLDQLAMRMAGGDREQFGIERLALDLYFEVGPTDPGIRLGEHGGRLIAAAFDVDADFFLNLETAWLASRDAVNIHSGGNPEGQR